MSDFLAILSTALISGGGVLYIVRYLLKKDAERVGGKT